MHQKVIFHIDVNSAFLSWEAVWRIRELGETEDLREKVAAIGGDQATRHGIILAKSIPAKKYKIQTGESLTEALRKCPFLEIVPPNHERYQKYSKAFMAILRDYSPVVEQYSIDEAFMDMTGTRQLFGDPVTAATTIKDRIYKELGFSVNVGISSNKLLAKMASDFQKPNKVHTLFPEEIEEKMWHLPVRELFFVGKATEKKLHSLGIRTIGQLAKTDKKLISSHLKKQGEIIWNFANGIDVSAVEGEPTANKGYGNSTTMAFDVTDAEMAKLVLLSLSETVGNRLRKHGVKAEVVSVEIRYSDLSHVVHQRLMRTATNITNEIYQNAVELFEELWNGEPIRLLGVQTSKVSEEENRQMSLFDATDYERLEKLDEAVDHIREKYGTNAIMRAAFIKEDKVKPMTGKREK